MQKVLQASIFICDIMINALCVWEGREQMSRKFKSPAEYIRYADKYAIFRGALLMIVFVLLLMYSIVRLSYIQNRDAAIDTLKESVAQSAAKIKSEIRFGTDRVRAQARAAESFESVYDENFLKTLYSSPDDSLFSHFSVRLANGNSLQCDGSIFDGIVWSSESPVSGADDTVSISSKTVSAVNGKEIFRIFAPVESKSDENGKIWVYGVTELDSLSDFFSSTGFGGNSSLIVFEAKTGAVLMDTDNWLGLRAGYIGAMSKMDFYAGKSGKAVLSDINNRKSGYTCVADKEQRLACAYTPVGVSDWYVMQFVPEQVLFGSVETDSRVMLASFTIILMVMLLFLVWINGRVADLNKGEAKNRYITDVRNRILAAALEETSTRVFLYDKTTGEMSVIKDADGIHSSDVRRYKNGIEELIKYEGMSDDDARRLKNGIAVTSPGKASKLTLVSKRGADEEFLRYTLTGAKNETGGIMIIGTARDVTEHERQKRRHVDLEKVKNAVVTYDTTGVEVNLERNCWKILWLNEPAVLAAGYQTLKTYTNYDSDMERDVASKVHAEDREIFMNKLNRFSMLEAFRRGETDASFEYRISSGTDGSYSYRVIEIHLFRDKQNDEVKASFYIRNIDDAEIDKYTVNKFNNAASHILSSVLECAAGSLARAAFADLESGLFVPVSFDGKHVLPKLEALDYDEQIRRYAETCVHPNDRQSFLACSDRKFLLEELKKESCVRLEFSTLVTEGGGNGVYRKVVRTCEKVRGANTTGGEIVIIERLKEALI